MSSRPAHTRSFKGGGFTEQIPGPLEPIHRDMVSTLTLAAIGTGRVDFFH